MSWGGIIYCGSLHQPAASGIMRWRVLMEMQVKCSAISGYLRLISIRLIRNVQSFLWTQHVPELFNRGYWTDAGVLIYESLNGVGKWFSENGVGVIQENDRGSSIDRDRPIYNDDELFHCTFKMFSSNVSLVEDPIFRWLNHKLMKTISALNLYCLNCLTIL